MCNCPCCGTEGPRVRAAVGAPVGATTLGSLGPGWAQAPTRRERRTGLEEARRRLEEQLADINEELSRE